MFNLLGIATRTLRENGMPEAAKEMQERVRASGSYDEALGTMMDKESSFRACANCTAPTNDLKNIMTVYPRSS